MSNVSSHCLEIQSELDSTGYSALPLSPRLMWRTHTQRDSVTDGRRATQYSLRSLSGGEGNYRYHCAEETGRYNAAVQTVNAKN